MQLSYYSTHQLSILSNYTGMTRTVQLHCPISAQIGPLDNQSDLRILFQFRLRARFFIHNSGMRMARM